MVVEYAIDNRNNVRRRDDCPCLGGECCGTSIADATGNDVFIGIKRVVAVQGKTMHGDAFTNSDANSGQFIKAKTVGDPNSRASLNLLTVNAKLRGDVDEEMFYGSHVADDIDGLSEASDRIADQLTGTVPRNFAPAVDVNHRSAVLRSLRIFGALARGIDGFMLKEEKSVGANAGNNVGVDLALKSPALLIGDWVTTHPENDHIKHWLSLTRASFPPRDCYPSSYEQKSPFYGFGAWETSSLEGMTTRHPWESSRLCGYDVLRYLPSLRAYRALPDAILRCVTAVNVIDEEYLEPLEDSDEKGRLIDVGRTSNGDLVLVETYQSVKISGLENGYTLIPPSATRALSTDTFSDQLPKIEGNDGDGWAHLLPWRPLIQAIAQGKQKVAVLRGIPLSGLLRQRGFHLSLVFVTVGVLLLLFLMGGIGATGKDTTHAADVNTRVTPAKTSDNPAGDPVTFAVAEVSAGRVSGLEESETSGAVQARVLSRNGEFVLVEVTRESGQNKAYATLLLQKAETGWRTRDVFEGVS